MEESIYTLDANSLTKQWLTDGHKRCDEPHSSAKNAIVQETQIESPESPENDEGPENPSDGEGKKIEDRQQKSFPYQRDCLDVLERVCNGRCIEVPLVVTTGNRSGTRDTSNT